MTDEVDRFIAELRADYARNLRLDFLVFGAGIGLYVLFWLWVYWLFGVLP